MPGGENGLIRLGSERVDGFVLGGNDRRVGLVLPLKLAPFVLVAGDGRRHCLLTLGAKLLIPPMLVCQYGSNSHNGDKHGHQEPAHDDDMVPRADDEGASGITADRDAFPSANA